MAAAADFDSTAHPPGRLLKLRVRQASSPPSGDDDASDFEERRQRLDVFTEPWMNSCLNETVLPGSPWQKLLKKILPFFIKRLKGQFGDAARKEAIFQLLGPTFIQKAFPEEKRDVMALMALEEVDRRQMVREAADWLNTQWTKATEEAKCQRVPPNEDVDPKQSPEMAEFLTHVYRIFYVGLDRSMFMAQARRKHEKGEKAAAQRNEQLRPDEQAKETAAKAAAVGMTTPLLGSVDPFIGANYETADVVSTARSSAPSEIAKDPAASRAVINNEKVQVEQNADNLAVNTETAAAMNVAVKRYKKNVALPVHAPMPPLSSEHSDRMGNSVVALLRRDPRRYADVVCKLHGRQLPRSLRVYLWLETLLRKERERIKQLQAEKIVRENFGRAIARGLAELNVKKAIISPIHSVIENALVETYRRSPGLHASYNDAHLKDAAEAMNALYISDRSYEVHFIFWLYPIQLAFEEESHRPEHPLDLALYLHLFRRDVFPGWDDSRKTAEQIVRTLLEKDPELVEHLADICRHKAQPGSGKKGGSRNANRPTADALEKTMKGLVQDENLKGLDPFIAIIYSWTSEGFVGVLDGHGVLFAWDQLMMFSWHSRVVEHIALSILMLLRHRLFEAFDFEGLQEILVQEPNVLYTVDLQAAFVYIEHNQNILEASRLNRQKLQMDELFTGRSVAGSMTGRLSARERNQLTNLEAILPRFGLRDLEIQLIIPNNCLQKYAWLYDLDVSKFSVVLSTYFGSLHMGNLTNAKPPFARDSATNSAGDIVHVIRFIDEFVDGPFSPRSLLEKSRDVEFLRRSIGSPNVFLALIYNGDFPLQSDERRGALFGWTQIGAWNPSMDSKTWVVPNDVKWYSLQTAKLALALAPLAALAERDILIDTDYSSHFSHLTVEIFNPTTVPVDAQLYDKVMFQQNDAPAVFADNLPQLDFTSVRQIMPPLPPSGGWIRYQPPIEELHQLQNKKEEDFVDSGDTFDFYVDAARFLPDNATITMAHLTFANSGSVAAPENVLFLSHLESSAKSPYYNGRVVVNDKKKKPTKDMAAILTIITVDKISGKSHVLGTAIFSIFKEAQIGKSKKTVLRTGGHQLRLIQTIPPTPDKRTNAIASDVMISLMAKPVIPAASVLVRLLPHQDKFADAPLYSSGYYQNDETFVASPFEDAIMTVAVEEDQPSSDGGDASKRPATVRDACQLLMSQRGEQPSADFSPAGFNKWMQQRCLRHGNFPENILSPADYLAYSQAAGVCVKFGSLINFKTEDAPQGPSWLLYCHCQLFPPKAAIVASGTKNQLFALEIDLDSPVNKLSWKDPSQTIYPLFNKSAVLLFVVYRLRADYIVPVGASERDFLRPGTLRSLRDKKTHDPPDQQDLVQVGWAVVPIYRNSSVFEQFNCQVDLVEGSLPSDPDAILGSFVKNANNGTTSGRSPKLEVSIVDGRRSAELNATGGEKTERSESNTVRSMLYRYISSSVVSMSSQEPPNSDRIKWHVDCCLTRVTSLVLSTLTVSNQIVIQKRHHRRERNN